jgi:hypothetical protein
MRFVVSASSILIAVLLLALPSCETTDEVWVTFETQNTLSSNSNLLCYCTEVKYFSDSDVTYGYKQVNSVIEEYWAKGQQCKNYGYVFRDNNNGNNNYDGLSGGTKPGPNGYFGGGLNTGSGSKPSYCNSPYNSPTNDVQLNSLCQTAYLYRCSGNTTAANFTCAQYKKIPQSGGGINCPYCN